jgi:hypothetical protein
MIQWSDGERPRFCSLQSKVESTGWQRCHSSVAVDNSSLTHLFVRSLHPVISTR